MDSINGLGLPNHINTISGSAINPQLQDHIYGCRCIQLLHYKIMSQNSWMQQTLSQLCGTQQKKFHNTRDS